MTIYKKRRKKSGKLWKLGLLLLLHIIKAIHTLSPGNSLRIRTRSAQYQAKISLYSALCGEVVRPEIAVEFRHPPPPYQEPMAGCPGKQLLLTLISNRIFLLSHPCFSLYTCRGRDCL